MKIGIIIDGWKLDIFTRILTQSGYSFTQSPGPTTDTLLLRVETLAPNALQSAVDRAQAECRLAKARGSNGTVH